MSIQSVPLSHVCVCVWVSIQKNLVPNKQFFLVNGLRCNPSYNSLELKVDSKYIDYCQKKKTPVFPLNTNKMFIGMVVNKNQMISYYRKSTSFLAYIYAKICLYIYHTYLHIFERFFCFSSSMGESNRTMLFLFYVFFLYLQ